MRTDATTPTLLNRGEGKYRVTSTIHPTDESSIPDAIAAALSLKPEGSFLAMLRIRCDQLRDGTPAHRRLHLLAVFQEYPAVRAGRGNE